MQVQPGHRARRDQTSRQDAILDGRGNRYLTSETLDAKHLTWLRRPDQDTGTLASLLPPAVGLPVRLTDNVAVTFGVEALQDHHNEYHERVLRRL